MRLGPVAKVSLILIAGLLLVKATAVRDASPWLSIAFSIPFGMPLTDDRATPPAETVTRVATAAPVAR